MGRYREQYDRMKRRYQRVTERAIDRSEQVFIDDLQAFFESCLHLRDWIAKDPELPEPVRTAATGYVRHNEALRLCRHIAVASKHLRVDRYPHPQQPKLRPKHKVERLPADMVYTEEEDFLPPGTVVEVYLPHALVETDDGEVRDALAFAGDCLAAWDEFFEEHGLT